MDHAQEKPGWLVSLSQTYMINFKSMFFPESTLLHCWHFVCSMCATDVSQVTPFPHSVSKVKLLLWVSAKAKALGRVWCLQLHMEQVLKAHLHDQMLMEMHSCLPCVLPNSGSAGTGATQHFGQGGRWEPRTSTYFWPKYSEGIYLSVTPESSSAVRQAHAREVGVPQWTQTEPVALLSLQFEINDMEQTRILINTADRLDKPLLELAETKATILVASWGCFQPNFFIAVSARRPELLPYLGH